MGHIFQEETSGATLSCHAEEGYYVWMCARLREKEREREREREREKEKEKEREKERERERKRMLYMYVRICIHLCCSTYSHGKQRNADKEAAVCKRRD